MIGCCWYIKNEETIVAITVKDIWKDFLLLGKMLRILIITGSIYRLFFSEFMVNLMANLVEFSADGHHTPPQHATAPQQRAEGCWGSKKDPENRIKFILPSDIFSDLSSSVKFAFSYWYLLVLRFLKNPLSKLNKTNLEEDQDL